MFKFQQYKKYKEETKNYPKYILPTQHWVFWATLGKLFFFILL